VPVLEGLRRLDARVRDKCRARLGMLGELGHEMRRPEAAYLGDSICELRILRAGQRYRILYGFQGRGLAVLLVGFSKAEKRVPERHIKMAMSRLGRFLQAPDRYSYVKDENEHRA
jgi:phage-related protein